MEMIVGVKYKLKENMKNIKVLYNIKYTKISINIKYSY